MCEVHIPSVPGRRARPVIRPCLLRSRPRGEDAIEFATVVEVLSAGIAPIAAASAEERYPSKNQQDTHESPPPGAIGRTRCFGHGIMTRTRHDVLRATPRVACGRTQGIDAVSSEAARPHQDDASAESWMPARLHSNGSSDTSRSSDGAQLRRRRLDWRRSVRGRPACASEGLLSD